MWYINYINFPLYLIKHYAMKTYGGKDASPHEFLSSALYLEASD
jgi:hypothetical protein